jgi:hypothetical protein
VTDEAANALADAFTKRTVDTIAEAVVGRVLRSGINDPKYLRDVIDDETQRHFRNLNQGLPQC